MAFCSKCGDALNDGVLFCGECGTRVASAATSYVEQTAFVAKPARRTNLKITCVAIALLLAGAGVAGWLFVGKDMWTSMEAEAAAKDYIDVIYGRLSFKDSIKYYPPYDGKSFSKEDIEYIENGWAEGRAKNTTHLTEVEAKCSKDTGLTIHTCTVKWGFSNGFRRTQTLSMKKIDDQWRVLKVNDKNDKKHAK